MWLLHSFLKYVNCLYVNLKNYLLPPRCFDCGIFVSNKPSLCHDCWKEYHFITSPICDSCGKAHQGHITANYLCLDCAHIKPPYDRARSIFRFDAKSKKLLHAFKYYDKTALSVYFAELAYARYKALISDADVIIAVPMHKIKRLHRMYNQAQLLASAISIIADKYTSTNTLKKIKNTKSQTFLTKPMRKKNLTGSIIVSNNKDILRKKVLLVDDVITTGTTVKYCAKLLKKAGAAEVSVISIAMSYKN